MMPTPTDRHKYAGLSSKSHRQEQQRDMSVLQSGVTVASLGHMVVMPLLGTVEGRPNGARMALGELAGVHVLVVEDTDDSLELLRIDLEYCGALVTTAASAEEATRILEHVRPHVLVSDVARPDDSIELIREVMTVAQRKGLRIPAIAVTAHRGRRKELMAEGFAELVEKPLDPIELCGTIRRHAQLQT